MDNQNISFALAKITTEQFAIIKDDISDRTIQLESNLRFAATEEKKLVGVFAKFSFLSKQIPFMVIECGCHFKIKKESWDQLTDKKNSCITIPKNILQHLSVITVGTTRGVLHSKTEQTKLNHLFLPTINIKEIINEDHSFNF